MSTTLFAMENVSAQTSAPWGEKFSQRLNSNGIRFEGREDLPEVQTYLAKIGRMLSVHAQTGSQASFLSELKNATVQASKKLYAIKGRTPAYRQGRLQAEINIINDLGRRLQKP